MNQRLINFFTKDLFAKVVSILLATLFFFMYRALSLEQVAFYMPIQVNLPENVAILSQNITTTKVTIRGTKEDLAQFDRRYLFLDVNTQEFLEGEHTYRIELNRNTNVNQLHNLSVSISPPVMHLTLEPIITKAIAIEAVLLGQPARGYTQSNIHLTPAKVEVTGPRSIVDTITQIRTHPVDISNQTSAINEDVLLNFDHPKVTLSTQQSHIYLDISSQYIYNYTTDLPIIITNLPAHLEIANWQELITAGVKVISKINQFDQLNLENVTLVVDLSSIESAGNYSLKPQLRNLQKLPDEYNIITTNITLMIEEKGSV